MEEFSPPAELAMRELCRSSRTGLREKRERGTGRLCPAVELPGLTSRPTEVSAQAKAELTGQREIGTTPLKPKTGLSGPLAGFGIQSGTPTRAARLKLLSRLGQFLLEESLLGGGLPQRSVAIEMRR